MKANSVHATLPAADLERAKTFYSEKLGLTPVSEEPAGIFYEVGQTRFAVFPTRGRPSGEHTQAGIIVDDVDVTVSELKDRGVVFEEYDFPDFKSVDSVVTTGATKGAWFKDSEGNLLGIVQFAAS
jgi:catechol 2,3-dioxygenase-like lactoylglutathione lyase family enzyme